MRLLLILMIAALNVPWGECARILGMFPLFAKSHHRMFQPVMRTLAQAGHEVVVYSPFPTPDPPPNYTDVYLENISVDTDERKEFFKRITRFPYWRSLDCSWQIYDGLYYELIEDNKIKRLLSSREKFDLIIVETLGQEFNLVFAYVFHAPVISLQAFYTNNLANSYTGNSFSFSFIPDLGSPFSDRMTFFQRLYNSVSSLRALFLYYNIHLPRIDAFMRQKFPDMPALSEMTKNISIIFINDHPMADYSQPRPPNMIPVAGIHIDTPKPLPKDIKRFMDEAIHGVIFFSLGTYVQDELNPNEYFKIFNNVFKRLKQRVLWKTKKENIEDLPDNVMTLDWAPQEGILAHPNCVLFITHGGLQSQHETIHYGVPVVGIPQFFDQHRNVQLYVARGVGVKVDNKDISEKSMTDAINKVLDNPSYRENMKKLSVIFKDRPMSPVESVVFWTEYVLRHGGAAHLTPASSELRWYQRALLDVIALIICGLVIIMIGFYFIAVKVVRFYCSKNSVDIHCRNFSINKKTK